MTRTKRKVGLLPRALLASVLLVFLLPWLTPAPLSAQEVRGRLLDGTSREPVVLGIVVLLDTTLAVADRTISDSDGAFLLTAAAPGPYLVAAQRVGYESAVDGILELGQGGSIEIAFYLKPEPLMLDSIRVSVERQRTFRYLDEQGFYQRQKAEFGHFITPDDVERRPPVDVNDLLRGIPNVRVNPSLTGTTITVRCGLTGPRAVQPPANLWVDGVRVPSLDLNVEDIAAVEIYSGAASTPLQYGGTTDGCGAVVIWTTHWRGR